MKTKQSSYSRKRSISLPAKVQRCFGESNKERGMVRQAGFPCLLSANKFTSCTC